MQYADLHVDATGTQTNLKIMNNQANSQCYTSYFALLIILVFRFTSETTYLISNLSFLFCGFWQQGNLRSMNQPEYKQGN